MTTSPEQAEDLTQDVFLKVHRNLSRFKGRSRFSTWLYAITHHHVVDELQNQSPLVRMDAHSWANLPLSDCPDRINPDEQWLRVQQVLNQLPEGDRKILLLRYEEGLSIEAICLRANLGMSAVKMRLSRSRMKLKKIIDELDD